MAITRPAVLRVSVSEPIDPGDEALIRGLCCEGLADDAPVADFPRSAPRYGRGLAQIERWRASSTLTARP